MINWYRVAKKFKITKPKAPKSLKPKKKDVFRGPKMPDAYKKKLYIPTKLVQASSIAAEDNSASALAEILDKYGHLRDQIGITWVDSTPDHTCRICGTLDGYSVSIEDVEAGIWGRSHKHCDCHLNVDLPGGTRFRISAESMYPECIMSGTDEEYGGGEQEDEGEIDFL